MPRVVDGAALLARETFSAEARLRRLAAKLADPADLDPRIELWVCLKDAAAPLVRVKLAELLGLGGERPLNVAAPAGSVVQLVLWVGDAVWPPTAGGFEVELTGTGI
jgi:hypothetical protein